MFLTKHINAPKSRRLGMSGMIAKTDLVVGQLLEFNINFSVLVNLCTCSS